MSKALLCDSLAAPRALCHAASTRPLAALHKAFLGACSRVLAALHAHGDAHAAADAKRGEALLGIPLLHFVEQRRQNARAGGADRMTDGDRAAIDVDLGGIPAEVLVDRASLRRDGSKGF